MGKTLYGFDRLPEQKLFLKWLLNLIKKENINYLLLSGDIFDRPTPTTQALSIYYQFIADLGKTECKLFLIGGNHDSGKLLECPSPLFNTEKIKLVGDLSLIHKKDDLKKLIFHEENITFTLLPYFKNHELFLLKELLTDFEVEFYNTLDHFQKLSYLFDFLINELRQYGGQGINILLAHHLFGQVIPSGSEIDIALCGPNTFSLSQFSHYDYLALGHIHSPHCLQKLKPRAVYSGAPHAYRFGEQEKKALSLIDFNSLPANDFCQSFIDIPCWRKLVSISYGEKLPVQIDSILPALIEVRFKARDFTTARCKELEQEAQLKNLILINTCIEKNTEEKRALNKEERPEIENDLKQMLLVYMKEKEIDTTSIEGLLNLFLQETSTSSQTVDRRGNALATLNT